MCHTTVALCWNQCSEHDVLFCVTNNGLGCLQMVHRSHSPDEAARCDADVLVGCNHGTWRSPRGVRSAVVGQQHLCSELLEKTRSVWSPCLSDTV